MTTASACRAGVWVLLGAVLLMRVYFALRVRRAGERVMPDRQAVEREGRGMFVARVLLFVCLLAWLACYAADPSWLREIEIPFPGWLRWAGFVLGLASVGFWTWTQAELGKEWSPQLQLRTAHHLVTTGPYARIRHPLYTAMLGYGAGLALLAADWVFVVLAVMVVAGVIVRVPREEQMMIGEFGEDYRAYMQRTGRFFPKRTSQA